MVAKKTKSVSKSTGKKSLSSIAGGIASLRGASEEFPDVPKLATGVRSVDKILGGGLPRGKIAELYGPYGGGKSALAMHLIGSAQQYGECVYVDLEGGFDPAKAANSGIDMDRLYFANPESGEMMFRELEEMVAADDVACIVIDSVAAIVTEAQLNGDYGDAHMAQVARLLSSSLPKLNKFMKANNPNVTLVFINQERQKIGGFGMGPTKYTTGGESLPYYASTRLQVARVENIKAGEDIIGQKVKVYSKKCRTSAPFQTAYFDIYYDPEIGISNESVIFDDAVKAKLITKAGAWYSDTATGETLGQGKTSVLEKMRREPELTEGWLSQL